MKTVYFGGDVTNPTLILRVSSLRAEGMEVSSFTFRRDRFNATFEPDWHNVSLGTTSDRKYGRRLFSLLKACWIIARNKAEFEGVDILYARLIDMAYMAQFAKWWFGLNAKLVYDIEDVQAVFFRPDLSGRLFRWLERWILARTNLVVVLSPGFVSGYLKPMQSYDGRVFLLENKLHLTAPIAAPSAAAHKWRSIRDRWVIGWFGTLRCVRSMSILSAISRRLGDKVEIQTRGFPVETGLAQYLSFVDGHPNWHYAGEYNLPADLEEMYGGVHFSWCFDFLDAGGNSNLLLACRMYQGGYYGSIPLASKGSEMDRFLSSHGIGHAFDEPLVENISMFLENLTWEEYVEEREKVLGLADELFLDTGADVRRLIEAMQLETASPRASPP